ncbi:putative serine protease K12H4.7 [Phlebotomus papatasi]|uniref:putative serine protease K12H4.7 n=1 Tax=Phlebotomus papatasi TaxID=29031 RepID=UPI0024836E82|nr:putative serine protease K12H4.7 [Phlebotomus papatasi]
MKTSQRILYFLLLSLGICEVLSNPWKILEDLHREPPPPTPKIDPRVVTEEWIEQKLDNFDDNNNATYQMRYLANAEFYQPGGPIFIYVGGEWSVSPGWITGGHTFDMARELNGYLFYTEHRFYGQSRPTPDLSFENLQYLHVNQALADLAHFIEVKKQEIPGASSSGVILVGASYSATMVTWFRQYYPHLINGAWSSSAPLLAKADFVEYFETVGESIRIVSGDECYNRLDGAFREAERMIEAGEFAALSELFNLCQPLTNNQLDIWNFFSSLSGLLAGVVQYHWPGDIEGTCEIIMSQDTDIDGFAEYARRRMGGCWSAEYEYFVEYYSRTQWTNNIMRQWLFQTCNEYGWYQTSGSNNQPFGSSFPIDFYYQWCTDLYDESFYNDSINYNIYVTNLNQNGMNPIITNVYSTHGQLDPWRPMGVQENVNSFAPTAVIPMASHCADLYSISDDDSPEMLASKLRTTSLVRQWLFIF